MAWQKTKICILATEVNPETGKKIIHRYLTKKSKGKNKSQAQVSSKLVLKKYNPILRKHVEYTETRIKWK